MKTRVVLFLLISISFRSLATWPDTTQLSPKAVFGKEARVISYLLDNNHYRRIKFGDSLSSVVFDKYFTELDNGKIYFLASDIASFEKYRTQLDDLTRGENVLQIGRAHV